MPGGTACLSTVSACLAVQSLVAAFADDKAIIDEAAARAAVAEVTAE